MKNLNGTKQKFINKLPSTLSLADKDLCTVPFLTTKNKQNKKRHAENMRNHAIQLTDVKHIKRRMQNTI